MCKLSILTGSLHYHLIQVLYEHGFPVPKPIDQARHCLVMELFDAFPLYETYFLTLITLTSFSAGRRQISDVADPGGLYSELMDLIVRLAQVGLIHGDFNEFNILIREADASKGETKPVPILIDFPQMVSTDHENAEYYFNRDVQCIVTFFKKRFRYECSLYPRFLSSIKDGKKDFELDVVVAASGFGKKEGEALERYMRMIEEAEKHEGTGSDEEEEQEEDQGVDEDTEGEINEQESVQGARPTPAMRQASENDDMLKPESEQMSSNMIDQKSGAQEIFDDDEETATDSDAEGEAASSLRANTSRPRISTNSKGHKDVQSIVASGLEKRQRSQGRQHHGKKGVTALGRAKGSKRKSDPRIAIRDSTQF